MLLPIGQIKFFNLRKKIRVYIIFHRDNTRLHRLVVTCQNIINVFRLLIKMEIVFLGKVIIKITLKNHVSFVKKLIDLEEDDLK